MNTEQPKTPPLSSYYSADSASLTQGNNVGHLMRQIQASINRQMDQLVLPMDLTAMQWRPMVLIRYRHIDTSAELARATHTDTGAMTRTLDRLEAKQFLTRHRCPQDRRVMRLQLTKSGKQAAEQILPAAAQTLNTHLAGFTDDDVTTLINLLHRMLANGIEKA